MEICKHLLSLRSFLCLCFAYIPIMMIRMGVANWTAIIFKTKYGNLPPSSCCIVLARVVYDVGRTPMFFLEGRKGLVRQSPAVKPAPH